MIRLFLAPMAGVTDFAFRRICRRFAPLSTMTEMVSARALVAGDTKSLSLLRLAEDETPAYVQLFGSDPDCMARAAIMALHNSHAVGLNINMGCPSPKIVSGGDGAALMKTPELAGRIIKAVSAVSDRPVSVKIRKGWDSGSINAVEFAKMAEDCGASEIFIHGRTRVAQYGGQADWDICAAVKNAVSIPVVANGDVFSGTDALRLYRRVKPDGIMAGRGAMGSPWLFAELYAALSGSEPPPEPAAAERMEIASEHFELMLEDKGEHIACLEMRKHLAWYLRGLPHCNKYKTAATSVCSREDVQRLILRIKRDYADVDDNRT